MSKNFKILIVVPRYNYSIEPNFSYNFPLGLSYISAVLKKEGYNVDCLNLNHHHGTVEQLMKKTLGKKAYDFVCTGSNALGYLIVKTIIDSARKYSNSKFILGGPIITTEPELVYNNLKPDYAVLGEGEETIIELFDFLEKNKDLKKVNGIIFKNQGNIVITPKREPIKDIDSLPFPDLEGLEYDKQLGKAHCNDYFFSNIFDYPRTYTLLASRSCPFHCTFCYHDSGYRQRSLDSIMKEVNEAVKKYKINLIVMYDECFSVNKQRLREFCKRIEKLKKEISWDLKIAAQLTVHNINEEILTLMKEAGVDTISYGFESFSPIVLKSMNKPITPEQISNAFHATLKAGIGVQANFIFGDVAETKETAKETLGWWKKNAAGQVGLGFIQPYPGSKIYEHCIKKGIIKDKLEFIKNEISPDHWYNMTDKMTDEEVKELRKEILNAMSKYSKFIKPLAVKKMKKNIYEFTVKCPYCKKIMTYKNCFIKNKFTYGFNLVCRDCRMRFFVVSPLQKLAYKNYSKVRALRDYEKKIIEYFSKKKI